MGAAVDVAGRVAIVTGAGRGLGLAMAEGLLKAGCSVVGTAARTPGELDALASSAPDRVLALHADVADPEDCKRVVEATLSRFGRLDVLVNNAGRGMRTISERFLVEPTKFWQADIQAWRTLIDTNVNGPFLMARAAVPAMLAAGWGRIVNVSVSHETMRRAGFSPYGPSKAALESETVIWAQDLAGTGVTVNALLPGGATRTGMVPPDVPERLVSTLLDPAIVVPPLLYLASVRSDGVTGRRFVATLWPAAEAAGWQPAVP
jgi:3-oxoacyl-[acyl-carrier protein] reductase